MTSSETTGGEVPSSGRIYHTALTDATNYHVKHPLQTHWKLYQKLGQVAGASSRGVSQENWKDSLTNCAIIGTVEDFCLYNTMADVTTIPVNCDYIFMKEGIEPMWEDPANKGGCDLRVSVTRSMDVAKMWKYTLMAVMGCQFKDWEFVVGTQFALRASRSRISIWMSAAPVEVIQRLKAEFCVLMERVCGIDHSQVHVDIEKYDKQRQAHSGGGGGGGGRGGRGGDSRGGGHRGGSGRHDRGGSDFPRSDRGPF